MTQTSFIVLGILCVSLATALFITRDVSFLFSFLSTIFATNISTFFFSLAKASLFFLRLLIRHFSFVVPVYSF